MRDILESCDLVVANTESVSVGEFLANITLQDAVIRRFEIIGEVVKRIPE